MSLSSIAHSLLLPFTSSSFLNSILSFVVASFLALLALQTASQQRRWAVLPILFLFTSAFSGINYLPLPLELRLLAGLGASQFLIVWFANTFSLLFVEKYAVPSTDISPWLSAYKVLYSSRRIPSAIPKAPTDSNADSPPKRAKFAMRQSLKIAICIFITTSMNLFTEPTYILIIDRFGLPTASLTEQAILIRRLPQITTFEVVLRTMSVIEFVFGTWALCTFFHTLFSLLFVCILRVDEPEEWPVLFGSFGETYSVRAFWGRFWHRLVSSAWLSLARPAVGFFFKSKSKGQYSNPTLTRGSMQRILVTGLVFLFSGINHGLVSWSQGFTCGWWEEITIYFVNFLAIVAEDVVVTVFVQNGGSKRVPTWLRKLVGYCWTWGFLFWCVPKVQYAKSMCYPES